MDGRFISLRPSGWHARPGGCEWCPKEPTRALGGEARWLRRIEKRRARAARALRRHANLSTRVRGECWVRWRESALAPSVPGRPEDEDGRPGARPSRG